MSGLLQKADLTMLEEQIQKMQNAYEYAEKTTQIIKKVQKKLRGQDGRRAVQIKNALHEQDERSQELRSDLKNLKDRLGRESDVLRRSGGSPAARRRERWELGHEAQGI